MKKLSYIIAVLLVGSFLACTDYISTAPGEPEGPWNPGPLTAYSVTPINGGATITYTIPNDPDIMYVMAEYERNGKIFTEKSSVHKNSITIEGFHRVDRVKATLYKVNKFEQRSEPLEVEFEPLESIIDISMESLEMMPGFGGIVAIWDNPVGTELGVRLMTLDDSLFHELVTREVYYSTMVRETHSFRGHEAKETTFALSFEDKWGNISDTVQLTTTPFFETMVPKPYADFRGSIPFDNTTNLSGRSTSTLWDNIVNTSSHGWLTNPGGSGLSITIDMKQVVKLSRIIHHFYHLNSPYGQVNITAMEIWGTNKIDFNLLQNRAYWLDSLSLVTGHILNEDPTQPLPDRTFKDDWQYLGYHEVPYYTVASDIQALCANGAEYEIPFNAAPVRYIRIFVREIARSMRSDNYFSMGEISFFGDNTVPQE
ncbi:DUF4959 domain-containing protein [Proteiniphilum sp. X52]|uniref:DUF4959 domain-containing protein n=1 Tax=Proteiniphilum sp. X52 TaxID=2382159 RepID=UPI000F09BE9C|nr:DUF4959 domain-containing protein [Proteiniphilum sp. X52]RNC65634.1 DUF4959 domain-containing protein [Proteiniphilum sp. X52]